MVKQSDILPYRRACVDVLWCLRGHIIASNRNKRVFDKDVADMLGLSNTAFSLAITGASSLSGIVFYRVLCLLVSFGVDVTRFLKSLDISLFTESADPSVSDGVDLLEQVQPED